MTQTTTTVSAATVVPTLGSGQLTRVTDDAILVGKWSTAITVTDDSYFTATPGTGGTILVQLSNDSGVTWRNISPTPFSVATTSGVSPNATQIRATATVATGTLVVNTPVSTTFRTGPDNSIVFASSTLSASAVVKGVAGDPGNIVAVYCVSVSGGSFTMRNGSSAAGTPVTGMTSISPTAGQFVTLGAAFYCGSGIYADLTGTISIVVLYQ